MIPVPSGIRVWIAAGHTDIGHKRVVIVDSDGAVLVAAVMPADVQDRDCLEALTTGKAHWPSLRLCLLDGAFPAERCRAWCNPHGMVHRVVERNPEAKGFEPVFNRWLVERTFGAVRHWGRPLVDRAGLIEVSTSRLACVAAMAALEALINPQLANIMIALLTPTGSVFYISKHIIWYYGYDFVGKWI